MGEPHHDAVAEGSLLDDKATQLLAAVHGLLSVDRVASYEELLLTSTIEVVAGGRCSASAILAGLEELWPGSALTSMHVSSALDRGRTLNLVRRSDTLMAGEPSWELTADGRSEVDATRDWYARSLGRFASDIQLRAEHDLGRVPIRQAQLWAGLVVASLNAAMNASEEALTGQVRRGVDGGLRPVAFDTKASLGFLTERVSDDFTRAFLEGCVFAAIDESEPFGNEIASAVATAAILRGVVARQPQAQALDALGSLTGQRVVVDTPCLLDLVSETSDLLSIVDSAISLGVEVIVFEHYITELGGVCDRAEASHPEELAITDPRTAHATALLVDDQVIELFLSGVARGTYTSWRDFRTRVDALPSALASRGVTIRVVGNHDPDTVAGCREALTRIVAERHSGRSRHAIDNDAETMAAVWRWRRRSPGQRLWPEGWVLTRDTKLNDAFAAATSDRREIALSPSHLSTLLATLGPSADLGSLVSVAASQLRHESMISVAFRYPPDVAMELAQSLVSSEADATDLRVAQLGLTDLLSEAAGHPSMNGTRIASSVLARRTRRLSAAHAAANVRGVEAEGAARDRVREAEARSAATEDRVRQLTEQLRSTPKQADMDKAIAAERERSRRHTIRAVVDTVSVCIAIVLALLGQWIAAAGFVGGVLLFHAQAAAWVEDLTRRWTSALWAALVAVAGSLLQVLLR